jgi:hypothetical protein
MRYTRKHSKKHSKRGGSCGKSHGGARKHRTRKHKTRRGGKAVAKGMLAKASGLLKTAAVPFGLVLANRAMKRRVSRKNRASRRDRRRK